MRTVVRDTQLAEQLVEVPTIVSCSLLQRTMEQHVDIPVPGRGGRNAGLQGFLPEQSSTATHSSEERISERSVELQWFRLGQSSSSSSHFPAGVHEDADEAGAVFFRTFHQIKKKCGVRILPESEGARQCQLIHAGTVFVSGSGSRSSLIRDFTIGTETRERHAGRWRMATCLAGTCGLMAATLISMVDCLSRVWYVPGIMQRRCWFLGSSCLFFNDRCWGVVFS